SRIRTLELVLAIIVAVGMTDTAAAQTTESTSVLRGAVTDQTGWLIVGCPGALVNGNRRANTTTDAQGNYAFNSVSPGQYTLTVTATGFLNFTAQVELRLALTTSLDVRLRVAPGSVC